MKVSHWPSRDHDEVAAYLDDVTGREILGESNYCIEEEQADHDTQVDPVFINSGQDKRTLTINKSAQRDTILV